MKSLTKILDHEIDLASVGDIRIRDIDTYLELLRAGSVRELARNRNISPGQISKAIRSLEFKLKTPMINRSSQGVTVSAEAEDVLNTLYSIQKLSYHLAQRQSTREKHKILSVASVSFFSTHLIPDIFSSLMNQNKQIRYRLIDLPPNQLIPVALRNGFQICVHMNELEWPRTWTSIQVGVMKWVLCCRKGHPLLKNPTQAQALKYPFLYPVYWSQEGLRYGDDSCPIPIAKRIRGTETATAASAAAVVERTDEIGFLPQILAEHSPNIEIIEMKNWKPIVKPVYLTVKSQLTSQKTFEQIQAVCREKLNF